MTTALHPAEARRIRSLHNCHRYANEPARKPLPRDRGAYVPQLSERLERDPNLTDGARRCARLIASCAYRRNRDGRHASITVSYLAKGLGRCGRTVQRYLRQLERRGYVAIAVVLGDRSRLCTGLSIQLLKPIFARHHRHEWPAKATNSGVTKLSRNYRQINKTEPMIRRDAWADRSRAGVLRALCRILPPLPFGPAPTTIGKSEATPVYVPAPLSAYERMAIAKRLREAGEKLLPCASC